MNKKYIWVSFLISVVIAGGAFYFWMQQRAGTGRTYTQSTDYTLYSIHEIKQNKLGAGTYNTEGYVVKIYTCPPCPKDARCKLCMRDNVVISENNQLLETYSLTDKELILFADNPKQFELGKKYRFSIKTLDYKSTGEVVNDFEIVGYDAISQNMPENEPPADLEASAIKRFALVGGVVVICIIIGALALMRLRS